VVVKISERLWAVLVSPTHMVRLVFWQFCRPVYHTEPTSTIFKDCLLVCLADPHETRFAHRPVGIQVDNTMIRDKNHHASRVELCDRMYTTIQRRKQLQGIRVVMYQGDFDDRNP